MQTRGLYGFIASLHTNSLGRGLPPGVVDHLGAVRRHAVLQQVLPQHVRVLGRKRATRAKELRLLVASVLPMVVQGGLVLVHLPARFTLKR
jgi:hypothetical protein